MKPPSHIRSSSAFSRYTETGYLSSKSHVPGKFKKKAICATDNTKTVDYGVVLHLLAAHAGHDISAHTAKSQTIGE